MLSDEIEALARGTNLTLEARRPGAEDVTAVVFPDAIARAVDRLRLRLTRGAVASDGAEPLPPAGEAAVVVSPGTDPPAGTR